MSKVAVQFALGLIACAGMAMVGHAARAESLYVVGGDARSMNLIDMESVKRSAGVARFSQSVAYPGTPEDKVYTVRAVLEFNCKEGKVRTLSTVSYGLDDGVLTSSTAPTDWQDAPAGTLMAKYGKLACGKMQPDPKDAVDDKLPKIAKTYRTAVASGAVK